MEGPVPSSPRPSKAPPFSLAVLATIASVFALSWAEAFVVPLLLGILIAYTLSSPVSWLEAIRVPRVIGTVIVLAGVIGAAMLGTYALRGQMQTIIEQLPEAVSSFTAGIERIQVSQVGNVQKIESAAAAVDTATNAPANSPAGGPAPATHVIVDQPAFRVGNYLWRNSGGAIGVVSQVTMVVFLVFFLLLGGDIFKRKLVHLSGPTLARRKVTVRVLNEVNASIQKYMWMLLVTNLMVGTLTWFALHWIGLENAGAWAAVAGLLHVVPYLGPGFTALALAMAAFMQFESFATALLVAGASLAVATAVGTFVTTWMTGRIASMNPAAIFISLLFWGWLWGIWGMLLGIPIIVIVKVVSQQVSRLRPVAELLGH